MENPEILFLKRKIRIISMKSQESANTEGYIPSLKFIFGEGGIQLREEVRFLTLSFAPASFRILNLALKRCRHIWQSLLPTPPPNTPPTIS